MLINALSVSLLKRDRYMAYVRLTIFSDTTMIKVILAMCVIVFMAPFFVKSLTVPPGCSYADGVFTCDYRFALPLNASLFDPKPQQLRITDVNGLISSVELINFDILSSMTFDSSYAASLEIRCILGGSGILTFNPTSFSGFKWVKDVKIVDCEFTDIPESAFNNFGSLNTLRFEGGNIDNLHSGALKGLNIIKDFEAPEPKGEFAMINTKFVAGGVPVDFFANSGNLTSIKMCNNRISVLQSNVFSGLSKLAYVKLNDNPFTYLKGGTFHIGLPISKIEMANIDWWCTCPNLWFVKFADDNNIKLSGEMICALPIEWKGKRVRTYYTTVCEPAAKCKYGTVPYKGICFNVLELGVAVLILLTCLGLPCALCITISNRRTLKNIDMSTRNSSPNNRSTIRHSGSRGSIGTLNKIGIMTIDNLE